MKARLCQERLEVDYIELANPADAGFRDWLPQGSDNGLRKGVDIRENRKWTQCPGKAGLFDVLSDRDGGDNSDDDSMQQKNTRVIA